MNTVIWLHGLVCGTLLGLFVSFSLILFVRMIDLTDKEVEVLFRSWWQQSYPTPPGSHSLMTHVSWGQFLLQKARLQKLETENK